MNNIIDRALQAVEKNKALEPWQKDVAKARAEKWRADPFQPGVFGKAFGDKARATVAADLDARHEEAERSMAGEGHRVWNLPTDDYLKRRADQLIGTVPDSEPESVVQTLAGALVGEL